MKIFTNRTSSGVVYRGLLLPARVQGCFVLCQLAADIRATWGQNHKTAVFMEKLLLLSWRQGGFELPTGAATLATQLRISGWRWMDGCYWRGHTASRHGLHVWTWSIWDSHDRSKHGKILTQESQISFSLHLLTLQNAWTSKTGQVMRLQQSLYRISINISGYILIRHHLSGRPCGLLNGVARCLPSMCCKLSWPNQDKVLLQRLQSL